MSKQPEVSTAVPRTREEFEKALAERKALSSMLVPPKEPAGQAAPGAPPVRYVEPARPASPPAPTVDVEKVTSARDKKLAEVNVKIVEMRKVDVALAEQEQNSKDLVAQMKSERQALLVEREELERDVIRAQQDLARQEALDLMEQQETAQARANNIAPGEQAAREVKALLEPLITKTVLGLAKLKGLLATHGSFLQRARNLRAPAGFTDENARISYINTSVAGGRLLDELHASIAQHERALQKASTLTSRATLDVDPKGVFGSEPDHTLVCEVQRALEDASGMVQAKRFGSSIKVPTPTSYNEAPTTSTVDAFTANIDSYITQFSEIVKRAPRPEIVITLKPKSERPRHEQLAALRGPAPQQTRAEGVTE